MGDSALCSVPPPRQSRKLANHTSSIHPLAVGDKGYPLRLTLLLNRILVGELQTNTVDTMPLISRGRISLALEHMSQVSSTVAAHDLDSLHAKRTVDMSRHSAGHRVEESGPATPGLELLVCSVEGC